MENHEIKQQILQLRKKIENWNHEYFDLQNPSVDDLIYDEELKKLKILENKYYFLFSLEELNSSPTQQIGAQTSTKFNKVYHSSPMLSLNKAYDIEELEKWVKKANLVGEDNFYVEPKIDGLSIALIYKKGKLSSALTRGDGLQGEDILHNALRIANKFIPKQINYQQDLEVRGEIFISNQDFQILQQNSNSSSLANPRNAASGLLRRIEKTSKNSKINDFDYLSCFIYNLVNPQLHKIKNIKESYLFLEKLGFHLNPLSSLAKGLTNIVKQIGKIEKLRPQLEYNIDGVVIKVNDYEIYEQLGRTSKFPHGAIAFKFEDQIVQTKLLDIFATVGRTGKITYNAKLEPINLLGTTVSAAILPNYKYIENLKIAINSDVLVKKSGEIIPQIIASVQDHQATNFQKISHCPSCNFELVDSPSGIDQFCQNFACPAIQLKKIAHFCSKSAFNIASLAEKRIQTLIDTNLIKNSCDIFFLKDNLDEMHSRFAKEKVKLKAKSITNFLNEIELSKKNDFYRFIFALGIKNIGLKAAKAIAKYVGDVEQLINFDFAQLENDYDFGPIMVQSLLEFFANSNNQELLNCFKKVDFAFKPTQKDFPVWASFAITGKLSKSRDQFEKIIVESGAQFDSNLNKKTTYLLAGESSGSKIEKAKAYNINIINEEQFWDLIEKQKLKK
ncbi:NAD(+)-dependent DNA ligase [Mesomycoplasma conjunctivae]|uniref:DNA ligase n=2 Tax=Mesomycoplasma conjunctivae TaxID=45361 RepID=C5J6R2_MESCH|nr:NAD-dependent DNA ligase LigA [Mesomycoplasma conjunctivae]CAT05172.1 DNA ligase [Mesomycoplasma conjunctivae]VEU66180.1 NAD(+)-dependent DNA ligase [Mesomycoplasma conjunctivae]